MATVQFGFPATSTQGVISTTSKTILGGVQSGSSSGDRKNVKDEILPDQLNTMVNELREYMKKQKTLKDEIERHTIKSFKKVNTETNKLKKDVSLVSSGIQKDACSVESLKLELSQELINAEIAQQTSNTPLAFQHENIAPREYFQKLVESFEERMHVYRRQVEEVESHLASLHHPQTVSPQEISDVMKKLHETFITLAARMHEIHELAKLEKERYLDYRQKVFGDRTNVFQRKITTEKYSGYEMPGTTMGPSPFVSNINNTHTYINPTATRGISGFTGVQSFGGAGGTATLNTGTGSALTSNKAGTLFGTTSFGQNTGTSLFGSNLGSTGFKQSNSFGLTGGGTLSNSALGKSLGSSGFGTLGSTTFNTSASSLQLQKPPTGNNKRGKK